MIFGILKVAVSMTKKVSQNLELGMYWLRRKYSIRVPDFRYHEAQFYFFLKIVFKSSPIFGHYKYIFLTSMFLYP